MEAQLKAHLKPLEHHSSVVQKGLRELLKVAADDEIPRMRLAYRVPITSIYRAPCISQNNLWRSISIDKRIV